MIPEIKLTAFSNNLADAGVTHCLSVPLRTKMTFYTRIAYCWYAFIHVCRFIHILAMVVFNNAANKCCILYIRIHVVQ